MLIKIGTVTSVLVTSYFPFYKQRGFTLLEMVTVVVILGILGALSFAGYAKFGNRLKEGSSYDAVRAVAAAQDSLWRSRGVFVEDPADLERLEPAYVYVPGNTPAAAGEISAKVSLVANEEVFGLAMLTPTGKCITLRQYQPRASGTFEDSRDIFAAGSRPCTGAVALNREGVKW